MSSAQHSGLSQLALNETSGPDSRPFKSHLHKVEIRYFYSFQQLYFLTPTLPSASMWTSFTDAIECISGRAGAASVCIATIAATRLAPSRCSINAWLAGGGNTGTEEKSGQSAGWLYQRDMCPHMGPTLDLLPRLRHTGCCPTMCLLC